MLAHRLSGWIVGGARSLVLLVLAFAPLVCLRVCQFRHAIGDRSHTPLHIRCDNDALPTEDSLLHDVQQLLSALTEFIPAAPLLALGLVALSRVFAAPLRLRTLPRSIPAPPPRLRFA